MLYKSIIDGFFNDDWLMYRHNNGYDIDRNEDGIKITMEVPGYNKKNINVKLRNDIFIIEGERDDEQSFKKSFNTSDELNFDKTKAKIKDGILTVDIPFKEEMKPKNIEIKVE